MAKRTKNRLRSGFTTGTAAAAAAKGALCRLLDGHAPSAVTVRLLNEDRMIIPIHDCRVEGNKAARCTVIKDAGDDPDVTHGAEIGARVTLSNRQTGTRKDGPREAEVVITGGKGVGTVTKPGLEVPPGNPAINPGPLRMIALAVKETLKKYDTHVQVNVEIFVPKGKALARKTLNERLGIVGGISILGTTGIVKPLSHDAYTATIRSSLSVAAASGLNRVVLTTGRRSERYAQALWPDLPDASFIQIGDFFRMSLEEAAKKGFAAVTMAVFFGKALKMAQGTPHTHAAKSGLTLHQLAGWAAELTDDRTFSEKILSANTARHAFDFIIEKHPKIIARVGEKLVASAKMFADNSVTVHAVIFDYEGNVVFNSEAS